MRTVSLPPSFARRLKLILRVSLGLLLLFAAPMWAQVNYSTNITLSHLLAQGGPVPYATVCAYPADIYGAPISIAAPNWGLILKGSAAGCGNVVNGALTSPIPVPDAAHTYASGPIYYNISLQVTNSAGVAQSVAIVFQGVANVTGTSWSLDSYEPVANVPFPVSNVVGGGSSVPSTCTSPSLFLLSTAPYVGVCNSGIYVSASFNFRGPWTGSTNYNVNDVFTNAGSSYIVTTAFTSGNTFATANVSVLAAAGASGALTVYSPSTTYTQWQMVVYNNAPYYSLIPNNTGNTPSTSASAWSSLLGAAMALAPRTNTFATDAITSADMSSTGGFVSETYAGNVAISLPLTSAITGGSGSKVTIKELGGAGSIATLTAAGGALIDGNVSLQVIYPGDITIEVDGSNYKVARGNGAGGAVNLTAPYSPVSVGALPGTLVQSPCPTTSGNYVLVETPSSGSATAPTCQALNATLVGADTSGAAAAVQAALTAEATTRAAADTANAAAAAAAQTTATALASAVAVPYPGYNMLVTFPPGETGSTGIDQTGNGNSCTFNSPAPTRLPTGGIQHNTGANTSTYSCTFPASTTLTDNTVSNDRSFVWCGQLLPTTTTNYPSYATIFGSSNRTGTGTLWLGGQYNVRNNYQLGIWYGTNGTQAATAQLVGAGYTCVGYTLGNQSVDGSVNHLYQMVNGQAQEVGTYTIQNGLNWAARAVGDAYTLGATPWVSGSWLPGTTEVVAGYSGQLTPAQIEQTMNAFQAAYLVGRGAFGNPSQSTSFTNQYVCAGDSLIANPSGTYNATSPCAQLALNSTWNISNTAVGGTTLITHDNDFTYLQTPHASINASYSVISEDGGINDLNLGGQTVAQVEGYDVQWLHKAASSGFNYLILQTHYSSTSSTDDTNVEALNAWLRSQAANFGGPNATVIVVDPANEPCLGAAGAWSNPGGLPCNFGDTGAGGIAITNCQQSGTTVTLTTATQSVPLAVGDSISPVGMTGACAVINSTSTSYTATAVSTTSVTFTRSTSATIASTATSGTLETVFQDGLHLFNGGTAEVGRIYSNVLNWITGSSLAYPTVVSANTTLTAAMKYISVTGSSAVTLTLDKCYGYSLSMPFVVVNNSSATVTVQAPAGFTLLGGPLTIAPGARAKYAANIVSDTLSGCQWAPQ